MPKPGTPIPFPQTQVRKQNFRWDKNWLDKWTCIIYDVYTSDTDDFGTIHENL